MRKVVIRSFALVAALTLFAPRATAQFPPIDPAVALAKLDPLLKPLINVSGHSRVIVRAQNTASMAAVSLLIQTLGGTLGRSLPIVEGRAADVPNSALIPIAGNALVKRVASDRAILGETERTGVTVGATAVRAELGVSGTGIGIAVIDSGVTPSHDDLAGRLDHFEDFVNSGQVAYDDHGHGTHVAGILAGSGADSSGRRTGVAPGAHLVALKALDGSGQGYISNVIAALDWVVVNKAAFQIRVVNLSIGATVYESSETDVLTVAARRVVEQGIVVVAAAGNRGRDAQGQTVYGAITAPGNAPWVLTVGASSHMGTVNRADDTVAAFSSRGPTRIDRDAKPDLVAPGVGIESLSAPGSLYYNTKSQYLLPGTVSTPSLPYLSLSGTSQATPVVAGTVALMLQANPALSPNAVKAILQYTAESHPDYDAHTQGAGFLNAAGAVRLAQYVGAPATTPEPSPVGWSAQVIWGTHQLTAGRLTATATAWGASVLWGAPTTPGGQAITWGLTCPSGNCSPGGPGWTTWGATCQNANCTSVVWGAPGAFNVVWGSSCGGADCESTVWTCDGTDTVVWGSNDENDTVVWGSDDTSDTVVWGSTGPYETVWPGCPGPGCPDQP